VQADILAKHPRSGDRLRYTVARYTAFQLVLGFLAGVVVLAALLGLFYWLTDAGSRHSYWFWWREAGLMLVGFQTQTTEASEHGLRAVVQAVASVLGLVVPALALGTVVFKSLVSDRIYATRRNLSVVPRENVLLQPSDDATTRRPTGSPFGCTARLSSRSSTSRSRPTRVCEGRVRLMSPRSRTCSCRSRRRTGQSRSRTCRTRSTRRSAGTTSSGAAAARRALLRVRDRDGNPYEVEDGCDLLLLVSGQVPQLGTDFVESHWFDSNTALSSEPFAEVTVEYPPHRKTWKGSRKWRGWDKFDEP
jgi:hypothetical protein